MCALHIGKSFNLNIRNKGETLHDSNQNRKTGSPQQSVNPRARVRYPAEVGSRQWAPLHSGTSVSRVDTPHKTHNIKPACSRAVQADRFTPRRREFNPLQAKSSIIAQQATISTFMVGVKFYQVGIFVKRECMTFLKKKQRVLPV